MTKASTKKEHWEKQYSNKDPLKVSWYQREPALSLQLIGASAIEKNECIIDVGGGASLLVDRLHEAGYSCLSVLDISENALKVAQSRLGIATKNIEWHIQDITQFQASTSYSLWHDRAVFHFLTEKSDRLKYVEVLKKQLLPDGHVILAAFALGGPSKCSGLEIVQYDSSKLLDEFGGEFKLVEEISERHMTPAGREQVFSYFRLIRA